MALFMGTFRNSTRRGRCAYGDIFFGKDAGVPDQGHYLPALSF
jgi:hypothetical protein